MVQDIAKLHGGAGKDELVSKLCNHVFDLAKMSQQQLTGDQMQSFIARSNQLLAELSKHNTAQ